MPSSSTRAFAPQLVDRIREEVRQQRLQRLPRSQQPRTDQDLRAAGVQTRKIREACQQFGYDPQQMQARESLERYKAITNILQECVRSEEHPVRKSGTYKIDSSSTHRVFGYLIFLFILFLIFQAIFAGRPIRWTSSTGASRIPGASGLHDNMAPGLLTDLLIDGIPPADGIVVFIPQIALLFSSSPSWKIRAMARVSFLMDRLMQVRAQPGIHDPADERCGLCRTGADEHRTIQNRKRAADHDPRDAADELLRAFARLYTPDRPGHTE